MLRKLAAALIAVTMFTAPVLAQGTTPAAKPAPTTQAPSAKAAVANAAKVKTVKVKKHVKVVKHIKKHRGYARCYGPRKHPKTAMTAPVLRTTAKVVPARTN